MIKLYIDRIDEEDGIVCVSLTSSDGGKIIGETPDEGVKIMGITRKTPIKVVLHENDSYYLVDGKVNFLKDKVKEFESESC